MPTDVFSKCPAKILWLTHYETKKAAPVEIAPAPDGNLVIDREKSIYRFATKNEKERAAVEGKNLYVSHFTKCEFAKSFRK